jgi:nucleoid-associated protein YgaU
MRIHRSAWSVAAALAVASAALAACGGAEPAPVTPQAPASAPAPVATAAPSAAPSAAPTAAAPTPGSFATKSGEDKLKTMKMVVQPTMSKLFQAFDAKRFGGFGCKTCHGPTGKDDPHNALPKLTLSNGGFQKLMAEKPAIMKFMGEQVVPAMATAMGEPPFDPATHKGFGCGGCHAVN